MGDMDETLRNGGDEAVLARLAAAVRLQPELTVIQPARSQQPG